MMTMRELAAIANVSVSTVSKAFHDADDVSDETKKMIFATANSSALVRVTVFSLYNRNPFAV